MLAAVSRDPAGLHVLTLHSLSADVGTIPVDVAITGAMKDSG